MTPDDSTYTVEHYDTANGDMVWTIGRIDAHGVGYDLNTQGQPIETLDEIRAFIYELYHEGAFSQDIADDLIHDANRRGEKMRELAEMTTENLRELLGDVGDNGFCWGDAMLCDMDREELIEALEAAASCGYDISE